jgi:hypothetical protein
MRSIESVFGTIETTEIPGYIDPWDVSIPPVWRATIVSGEYMGRFEDGDVESRAIKGLIMSAAARYAADIQDGIDGIDRAFNGGPEDA